MKHNFEERKQNRIDNAKLQAAKYEKKSDDYYVRASEMASFIPMGQPILVGHHSEKRDRNYRRKIDNNMRKSVEASKTAQYYANKAATIEGNTAISSDDPEALTKLKKELQELEGKQQFMKEANKLVKKKDRESFLKMDFATAELWDKLTDPKQIYRGYGFPSYKLANNSANIRRVKDRIAHLEKVAALKYQEMTINNVLIILNPAANRVQLFFPDTLNQEEYKEVRRNGFIWCKSENAFQRKISGTANRNAVELAKKFRSPNP